MIKRHYVLGLAAAVVFALSIGGTGVMLAQQDKDSKTDVSKKAHDEADRARDAAKVMTEIMGISEDRIPDELMQRAKGIAVFPNVMKGAFGIGGQYGKGLVSQRMANGRWSAPAFVSIGGGSFGFQLGVSSTDLVLVFTNDDGLKSLLLFRGELYGHRLLQIDLGSLPFTISQSEFCGHSLPVSDWNTSLG